MLKSVLEKWAPELNALQIRVILQKFEEGFPEETILDYNDETDIKSYKNGFNAALRLIRRSVK